MNRVLLQGYYLPKPLSAGDARADVPEGGEGLQGYRVSVLCRRAYAVIVITVITVNDSGVLLVNGEPTHVGNSHYP